MIYEPIHYECNVSLSLFFWSIFEVAFKFTQYPIGALASSKSKRQKMK